MSIFSIAAVFAGCDLVTTNTAKVLAATVVEVVIDGETITITKEQLLIGYNNYGAGLVQNSGYTVENAVKSTVDLLINREIILFKAKQLITLTEAQEQQVWKDTYASLNSNLAQYESTIKAEKDIVYPTNPTEEEPTITLYTPFEREVELVLEEGVYTLRKVVAEQDELEFDPNFVSGVEGFVQITTNDTLGVQAMQRYIKQLKSNEKEKKLSTVDAEVWAREVERIYKNTLESLYLTKFEELYEAQFNISLQTLISRYVSLTREDYINYANETTFNSYFSAAKENISGVYYHPTEEFFKVSHILMQYSSEQQAIVDQAKSDRDAGYISGAEYKAIIDSITAAIRGNEKSFETGLETGNTPLASSVLESLQLELAGKSYEQQTQIFNNYIYRYNTDPGIMNAEKPYVVGLTQSDMVEAFTNASRDLNSANIKGAISGLVATEYGVHIIMFLGKVENLVTISDISTFNNNSIDIERVFNYKLYDLNTKTMLDQIYDMVKTSQSTSYQNMLLSQYRANSQIRKYESKYSYLWQ